MYIHILNARGLREDSRVTSPKGTDIHDFIFKKPLLILDQTPFGYKEVSLNLEQEILC